MFCCCGPTISSGAPSPSGARSRPISGELRERAEALARSEVWADAHAHPGRCFLTGLPDDDLAVKFLGAPDPDRAFSDLEAGHVGLTCFASVGDLRVIGPTPTGEIRAMRDFAPGEAADDHRRQLRAIGELASGPGRVSVRTAADLDRVRRGAGVGVMISCEGADFLEGRIDGLAEAFDAGARSITLVHYRVNELGDIQTEEPVHGGLTEFGSEVVTEMNRLGMVVDLAHATWDVTKQVLDRTSAPVMISHSHLARGGASHPRLVSEEHALAVTRAGGVVAAWPSGVVLASLEEFVEEILRMLDLLGVDHVAIGTDMDANYQPVVTSHRQYVDIAAGLLERGVAPDEANRILGGNLMRLFAAVLV